MGYFERNWIISTYSYWEKWSKWHVIYEYVTYRIQVYSLGPDFYHAAGNDSLPKTILYKM